MAAPVYQTISNTTYAARTNTTITAPASIANGDLLIIFQVLAALGGAPTPTPPAGFTALPGSWPLSYATPDTFNVRAYAWSKVAASESGSYLVTHAACSSQGVMIRVSGQATTPFNPTPTLNTGSGATTTWLGLTTTVDEALILAFEFDWADTATNTLPPTGTTPTFTERLDVTLSYLATGPLSPAGATGDKTHTNNATGISGWGAALIAIEPPSVADPVPPFLIMAPVG